MEESPFIVWRMRSDPKLVRFRLGRTHSLRLSWFSFSLPGRPRRVMASFLSSVALGRQGKYKPMPSAWFACGSLSFLSSPRLCVVDPLSPLVLSGYCLATHSPVRTYSARQSRLPRYLPFPPPKLLPPLFIKGGKEGAITFPFRIIKRYPTPGSESCAIVARLV
jgi:hypothetical protein